MIKLLLGLFMASFSLLIQAQTSCWVFPSFPGAITPQPTASQACTALASARGGTNPVWYPDFNQCTFINSSGVSVDYNPSSTACVPSCPPLGEPALGITSETLFQPDGYKGGLLCWAGCKYYPTFAGKGQDGKWHARGPITSVGVPCETGGTGTGSTGTGTSTQSPSTPQAGSPTTAPSQAPPGYCPGEFMGITMWVPCVGGQQNTVPSSTSTGTSTGTPTVPTITSTECQGGNCTTTHTPIGGGSGGSGGGVGTGGGSGGSPVTVSHGESGFCRANPSSPMCQGKDPADTCGMPGKPPCKIDETGTPNGSNFGKAEKDAINSKWDEITVVLTSIPSTSGKDTSWALPSWVAAGTCQPYHLGNLGNYASMTLDLCPHVPIFNGVMTLFWIVLGFVGILAMVFRATTGAK